MSLGDTSAFARGSTSSEAMEAEAEAEATEAGAEATEAEAKAPFEVSSAASELPALGRRSSEPLVVEAEKPVAPARPGHSRSQSHGSKPGLVGVRAGSSQLLWRTNSGTLPDELFVFDRDSSTDGTAAVNAAGAAAALLMPPREAGPQRESPLRPRRIGSLTADYSDRGEEANPRRQSNSDPGHARSQSHGSKPGLGAGGAKGVERTTQAARELFYGAEPNQEARGSGPSDAATTPGSSPQPGGDEEELDVEEDSLAMLGNSKGSDARDSPTSVDRSKAGLVVVPSPATDRDSEEDDEVGLLGARTTSAARRGKAACSTPRTTGGLLTHLAGTVVGAAGGSGCGALQGAPSSPATPPPASLTRGARESLVQESDYEAAQRRSLLEGGTAGGAAAGKVAGVGRNGGGGIGSALTGPLLASAEQELAVAVHKFNDKPKAGVNHLISRGVIPHEAGAVAHFLRSTKGLSKRRIGDYLGERSDFTVHVLAAYSHAFDFGGMSFVEAVRPTPYP